MESVSIESTRRSVARRICVVGELCSSRPLTVVVFQVVLQLPRDVPVLRLVPLGEGRRAHSRLGAENIFKIDGQVLSRFTSPRGAGVW